MIPLITDLLRQFNPYLQPFYGVIAWLLLLILGGSLLAFVKEVGKRGKIMHQIPCTECQYFTYNYSLKCTVQPSIANTELAIDCPDFKMKK